MIHYETIADLTGDFVLYRDMNPYETALPNLDRLRATLGLPDGMLPRKRDAAYGHVMWELLKAAQEQRHAPPLKLLLVIGDTDNDRMMAEHLRAASGLQVFAFIGADRLQEEPATQQEGDTTTANRWSLLEKWLEQVKDWGSEDANEPRWQQVALLLDIDKTLLGPRGRNHTEIDEARAEAAFRVAQAIFGPDLDVGGFRTLYDTMCRSEFYSLTLDNQDYIVYITMLLACGVLMVDDFLAGLQDGSLDTFSKLLQAVTPQIPYPLAPLHREISTAHEQGDPTPFKTFRRAEFAATVERMDSGTLILCREVFDTARQLGEQGVLCMAASDKPAESAIPVLSQTAAGLRPLHRTPARID